MIILDNNCKNVANGRNEIRTAGSRFTRLIRQLLWHGREQGLNQRNLDLNEAVIKAVKKLPHSIGENLCLNLQLHPVPLITHADLRIIDQVVINLIFIARDAMPSGGSVLIETFFETMEVESISIGSKAKVGRYVCVSVSHGGVGISLDALGGIFESSSAGSGPGTGTSLRLAVVFEFIKEQRGFLRVNSAPGRGAQYQIFLPVGGPNREHHCTPAHQASSGGTETILIVDEDGRIHLQMHRLLNQHVCQLY